MQNPDVHYAGDGLGPRDVFVNGNPINYVVYANLVKGLLSLHLIHCGLNEMVKSIPVGFAVL